MAVGGFPWTFVTDIIGSRRIWNRETGFHRKNRNRRRKVTRNSPEEADAAAFDLVLAAS
jgi:hypothetical protein